VPYSEKCFWIGIARLTSNKRKKEPKKPRRKEQKEEGKIAFALGGSLVGALGSKCVGIEVDREILKESKSAE